MELIASGREADVFAVEEGRVLRRCRDLRSRCEHQAEIMEWVRRQGYPVPRVFSVAGPDMVLERIEGPTMVESLLGGDMTVVAAGETLAELLHRLHALAPPPDSNPDHAVQHLDLHPFNVISSPSGPVVIDWRNSDIGRPGVDAALTGVILAQVVLAPADLVPPRSRRWSWSCSRRSCTPSGRCPPRTSRRRSPTGHVTPTSRPTSWPHWPPSPTSCSTRISVEWPFRSGRRGPVRRTMRVWTEPTPWPARTRRWARAGYARRACCR